MTFTRALNVARAGGHEHTVPPMPMIHFLADTYRGGVTAFIDTIPAYGEGETNAEAADDLKEALRWLNGIIAERFRTAPLSTDLQRAWDFIDRILDAAAAGRNTVPDPTFAAVLDTVMKEPLPAGGHRMQG